ncbi:hypothetical protein TTHERM_000724812 (macronuclear) [Tetrahymena thermophila SB210]|uniref:Uncharacterized protein n=1 Tax=Tetrahymena thermophila (strain SB210) TaxID=312017 RepID=W7X408_TETTS|nr:hypothetical protein TTHERM_000724812 [Tetrahymena thermophila SB210]EWS71158.1 hypothetical protein TTHERM_000724812 [Tetrahymena thermophila SB210]|eukprot:XP_012656299.1 hypothetical protein TTHERM_000724812 [Tetrahymena thermophila SB210]
MYDYKFNKFFNNLFQQVEKINQSNLQVKKKKYLIQFAYIRIFKVTNKIYSWKYQLKLFKNIRKYKINFKQMKPFIKCNFQLSEIQIKNYFLSSFNLQHLKLQIRKKNFMQEQKLKSYKFITTQVQSNFHKFLIKLSNQQKLMLISKQIDLYLLTPYLWQLQQVFVIIILRITQNHTFLSPLQNQAKSIFFQQVITSFSQKLKIPFNIQIKLCLFIEKQ